MNDMKGLWIGSQGFGILVLALSYDNSSLSKKHNVQDCCAKAQLELMFPDSMCNPKQKLFE